MKWKTPLVKFTARVLLLTMVCQLVAPAASFALTSGPSQPEVQSFEPVGTTNMVDLFTGDFVYNIPLLDIDGYPVNIAYHGGINMEQESSWVGLGWNINPGVVNRSVRGLPDDFSGDIIEKTLHIEPERNLRVGLGLGAELAGVGQPILNLSADLSANLNVNNYRGISADFTIGAGVNAFGWASAGVNMGVSSQNGADVDYNCGVQFSSSRVVSTDLAVGVGVQMSHGYNTRSGIKDRTFSISANASAKKGETRRSLGGIGMSASVPISIHNIVPVVTNRSVMEAFRGQIKLGGELFGIFGHVAVYGSVSDLHYDADGSRPGYGYLYADRADDASVMDFTRDKDGLFNETMHFLPSGNMTYDVYSVSGQGTGGSFRPFRNDLGTVYDPVVTSVGEEFSLNLEVGFGNLFELGGDGTLSHTDISSGPWEAYKRPFAAAHPGSIYESVYFKQAGEITANNETFVNAVGGLSPIKGSQTAALPIVKPGSQSSRDSRANLIYYFTAREAAIAGVASSPSLYSYQDKGFSNWPNVSVDTIPRVGGARKADQISEIVQVLPDGRRYVYGLPAMNTQQEELTFSTQQTPDADGLVSYTAQDASVNNANGPQHYYLKTTTPAYAHSYLLTSVRSADYVDISGNGATDDDFGSFTKFNYTLKDDDYKWQAPYKSMKARHNEGFKSDPNDDKASVLKGSREQWILHSIESKNLVAEFYSSPRLDGKGAGMQGSSYKLDSISLYSKHDRFINAHPVPIKTIIFQYDYSLCRHVPNTAGTGANDGKLTLKKIFIRYGHSDKNMLSPYRFTYSNNYAYAEAAKDRWGVYKPNTEPLPNWEFPFVKQGDPKVSDYAAAWSLTEVKLPSGGSIHIDYEADDYAFVQDKEAMSMFLLAGVGNSKAYAGGTQLYQNKQSPYLYFYFNRRTDTELPGVSFRDNYLKGQSLLYYNFYTKLVNNSFESVKGYAEVEEVGVCSNDPAKGYVKVKSVAPEGGGAVLNPVTYTAINLGRYYLPHIIFPGNNPDNSDVQNVLSGLKYAFSELLSFAKNPVKRMVEEGKAKEVNRSRSFMRLTSPGLRKKGGGARVKKLTYLDNWAGMVDGNAATDADYGKVYDYTTTDNSGNVISSGVASYEPQIGGDENPFRAPVNYSVQAGSHWPPNDPVGVYQELPIGESLYPSPVVGYSQVTVTSIHQEEGRSSQGKSIHSFYTAKDFPIRAASTPLDELADETHYSFTEQERLYQATQGYTLIFNDMHGKPKRVEHRIIKPGNNSSELVSYQQYTYFTDGNQLSSKVPVIEYDPAEGKMKKTTRLVGYEVDLTVDTREKKEKTTAHTLYANFNLFFLGIIPVPIPLVYGYDFNATNQFNSVVATKVIQQYGILKSVQSAQEGAVTTVHNEAFDPVTGQALITSVNNEFGDRTYSVNYPAWWGYKTMGPAYANTGYTQYFAQVPVSNYEGELPAGASVRHYRLGDELLIEYDYQGQHVANTVWVTGFRGADSPDFYTLKQCLNLYDIVPEGWQGYIDTTQVLLDQYSSAYPVPVIQPRFKYRENWPGTATSGEGILTNVTVKVIRSGAKNQLTESIQSYAAMEIPFDQNGYLKDSLSRLVHISARTFSDTLTAVLPQYDSLRNPATFDSLNPFVNGSRQIHRLYQEYVFMKDRNYMTDRMREAGLFSGVTLWHKGAKNLLDVVVDSICFVYLSPNHDTAHAIRYYGTWPATLDVGNLLRSYMEPVPQGDWNWVPARTITKYNPWGGILEQRDAIGTFSTTRYGYNHQLPVAVAQNARQHEVFSENFEDFILLQIAANFAMFRITPFVGFFSGFTPINEMYTTVSAQGDGMKVDSLYAHSGNWSLYNAHGSIPLKVVAQPVNETQAQYLPFVLQGGKEYVFSYWMRPQYPPTGVTSYSHPANVAPKSMIIDGWQQMEGELHIPASDTVFMLSLPYGFIDDIRIYPKDANMKSFVYDPFRRHLMAILDENNFATFFEYDQEGKLLRSKRETERGIMTLSESRSAHPASQ